MAGIDRRKVEMGRFEDAQQEAARQHWLKIRKLRSMKQQQAKAGQDVNSRAAGIFRYKNLSEQGIKARLLYEVANAYMFGKKKVVVGRNTWERRARAAEIRKSRSRANSSTSPAARKQNNAYWKEQKDSNPIGAAPKGIGGRMRDFHLYAPSETKAKVKKGIYAGLGAAGTIGAGYLAYKALKRRRKNRG